MLLGYLDSIRNPYTPRGGGLQKIFKCMWMCDVPAGVRNFDFHYIKFCPHLPQINIPILYKKHPILLKLGAFYHRLLKIHPIYVNWVPSSVMKPLPRSLYQNQLKSAPKGRHINLYHVNVSTPPIHPLWKIYNKSAKGGVRFLNGFAYWKTPFENHTPSAQHFDSICHRGCTHCM